MINVSSVEGWQSGVRWQVDKLPSVSERSVRGQYHIPGLGSGGIR